MFVSTRGASILHADLDAFFASVEQRDDPRLRGRPVIVGAGVVLAASYEAKAFGVRTAMGGARLAGCARTPSSCRRGCRPTRRRARRSSGSSRTRRRSSRGSRSTRRSSTSAGWSGASGRRSRSPRACAREVRERVGLPITVGVARTKFLAKVASGVAKPDGLLVVPPDGELAFLHPLEVERLWGVGPVTAGEAPLAGHHDGRPARARAGGGARRDARARDGPASARARPQPRPAARAGSAPARLDRLTARPGPLAVVARVRRRRRRRARRPGDAAHACRAARRAHGRAPASLRRLHACDPLPHAAAGDGEHSGDPRVARALVAASLPELERRGLTLVGISVANLEDASAVQLALPFDRGRPRGARRGPRRGARPVRLGGDHPRRASRA